MKKKLFLLITCFFLFFSLTVFFVYQRIRSPEVHKKNKKDRNLITEKDSLDKEEEEENEDLPWTFTWKEAIASSILSILIAVLFVLLTAPNNVNKKAKILAIDIISFILYMFIFPLIFAIQKYKDKNYGERILLIMKSPIRIIIAIIMIIIFVIIIIIACIICLKQNMDEKMDLKIDESMEVK